jgi:hypothetical protein
LSANVIDARTFRSLPRYGLRAAAQVTGIAELLTPLAASGLIVFQLVAFVVHARRKQYSNLPVNVVFAAAALFVAVGRFWHWH